MNMGPRRGTPKKKIYVYCSPFDLKLSTRIRSKVYCKNSKGKGVLKKVVLHNGQILNNLVDSKNKDFRNEVNEAAELIQQSTWDWK